MERGMARFLLLVMATMVFSLQMISGEEAQVPRPLLNLSDANFEHDTQASTGQTTGSWLVLFTSQNCQQCVDAEESLLRGLASSESSPILAKVDLIDSPKSFKRFNVTVTPDLKLFHDRKMFSYHGDWSFSDIVEFAKGGWSNVGSENVPKEISTMDEILTFSNYLYRRLLQILADHPGILVGVASIVAMGGYFATHKMLLAKPRRPVSRKHGLQRRKAKKSD